MERRFWTLVCKVPNPNENCKGDKGTLSIHQPTHPTTHIANFIHHEKMLGNPKCWTHWSCAHMIARSSTPKKYPFLLSFLNPKWIIAHFGRVNKWFPKKYPLFLLSFLNPKWIKTHFGRVNKWFPKKYPLFHLSFLNPKWIIAHCSHVNKWLQKYWTLGYI
jgi:hypothetical protein